MECEYCGKSFNHDQMNGKVCKDCYDFLETIEQKERWDDNLVTAMYENLKGDLKWTY